MKPEIERNLRTWLYMEAIKYACYQIRWANSAAYKEVHGDKQHFFRWALDNWDLALGNTTWHCGGILWDEMSWISADCSQDVQGVTAIIKNKGLFVQVGWNDVKRYLEELVSQPVEGRQISMAELMAEFAEVTTHAI